MTKSFTGRKRIRKTFGRIGEVAPMPNLIEVQKSSYDRFLQTGVLAPNRADSGLQEAFKTVFPISDFSGRAQLEFVKYELENPKYDVEECQQRGMTYAAPLKVTLRLVVWDIDEDTGARSIRDIKEQDVYMGDLPLMTDRGTFIVNGTERVIVSQMHRSPGVFFDHDKGKTQASGKFLFSARVIPYRGSWLDFEFDAKDIIHVRFDRRRKMPVTTLLYALGLSSENILDYYYDRLAYKKAKGGWSVPFDIESWRGIKSTFDLVDAKSGEVIVEAGKKITPRLIKKIEKEYTNIDGYVLDLRSNPGGLLSQAVKVSDIFLKRGEIVSTRGRDKKDIRRYRAKNKDHTNGKPIVVLINGGSASASEIVAGALQDHRRAIIVGTQSFGKGSVQTIIPFQRSNADNVSGIRLTTARYYTPSGESIQGKGITPDIIVEQGEFESYDFKRYSESDLKDSLDKKEENINEENSEENELSEKEKKYENDLNDSFSSRIRFSVFTPLTIQYVHSSGLGIASNSFLIEKFESGGVTYEWKSVEMITPSYTFFFNNFSIGFGISTKSGEKIPIKGCPSYHVCYAGYVELSTVKIQQFIISYDIFENYELLTGISFLSYEYKGYDYSDDDYC